MRRRRPLSALLCRPLPQRNFRARLQQAYAGMEHLFERASCRACGLKEAPRWFAASGAFRVYAIGASHLMPAALAAGFGRTPTPLMKSG